MNRVKYLLTDLLYLLLLAMVFPWFCWQGIRRGKYRDGLAQRFLGLGFTTVSKNTPRIWLHAVSVGEVNLLEPILHRLQAQLPDYDLVITVSTVTGFHHARKKYAQYSVFYSPLDFSWAVARAIRHLRPHLVVLAELELWPNLIRACDENHIPLAVVNGRLSDRSFRGYSCIAFLLRNTFRRLNLVCAQTTEYAERFQQLGVPSDRIVLTGSIKFDGAASDRMNVRSQSLRRLANICSDEVVWIAGSTQIEEERMTVALFQELADRYLHLRLIIVPRHAERFDEVAAFLQNQQLAFTRRSRLSEGSVLCERILLVDTIGELNAWWGLSHIAFVGGSFGRRGGQNMIEPAAYGAAVCFGPNTKNFRDIVQLMLQHEAAVEVHSAEALKSFVERCLIESSWRTEIGDRARRLVLAQQGAADKTIQSILCQFPRLRRNRQAA